MTSGQERNTVIQINVMFQLAMSVDQRIRLSAVAGTDTRSMAAAHVINVAALFMKRSVCLICPVRIVPDR